MVYTVMYFLHKKTQIKLTSYFCYVVSESVGSIYYFM